MVLGGPKLAHVVLGGPKLAHVVLGRLKLTPACHRTDGEHRGRPEACVCAAIALVVADAPAVIEAAGLEAAWVHTHLHHVQPCARPCARAVHARGGFMRRSHSHSR